MEELRLHIHEMKRLVLLMEYDIDRVVMKLRIARAEVQLYEREWEQARAKLNENNS